MPETASQRLKEKGKQREKGKAPSSYVRRAKIEEVVNDREDSNGETTAPSKEDKTPPSHSKGDNIVAMIWSMMADKKELLLELLVAEGFLKHPMPTARLRTVSCKKNEMYIWWISTINMKIPFRSLSEQAKETVLINSGATENFLNRTTWERMGIDSHETIKPITVYNMDEMENRQGKITHYC